MAKTRILRKPLSLPPFASILTRVFSVDLRALALLRIGLGALVLAAVGEAAWDRLIFYVDDGPWPIVAALAERPAGRWSLHFLHGSLAWQAGLAALEALAGLAVLLGWRTRFAVPLAWLLTISVQSRSGIVLGGGSTLLRLLLFWGMWLPLGARWSLDARRRGPPAEAPGAAYSVASAALLLQIAAMYLFNVLHKTGPAWHSRGDAVAMSLQGEIYARPLGRALLEWPALLDALTPAVFWLEAIGPLLAFSPWGTARVRGAVVACFLAFHAGLALTMNLGNFPYTCMVAWLAFLPFPRGKEPASAPIRLGAWPNLLAAVALLYVLAWNVRSWVPSILPRGLLAIGQALRLDQRWGMFSPGPWKTEGWLVVVGTDARGRETNLLTGASPVDWRRPPDLGTLYPTTAWRKYSISIAREGRGRAHWYAEWLVRQWQRAHPAAPPFARLEVFYLATSIYDHTAVPDNYLLYETPATDPKK